MLNTLDDLKNVPYIKDGRLLQALKQKSEKLSINEKTNLKIEVYIPDYNSSAYNTLMALWRNISGMSKEQLKTEVGEMSHVNSIWIGLKLLIREGYVKKVDEPLIYQLTDNGKEVAEFLKVVNDIVESQGVEDDPESVLVPFNPVKLESGKYKIRLVIDNREIASLQDRKYFITELKK